ncbi:hypothetical protein QTP86_030419, partial [Hemibagrus guttatus]
MGSLVFTAPLFIKKVSISPSVKLGHAQALLPATAKYPIERVCMKTFSLAAGSRHCSQENLFLGPLRKTIIFGMIDNNTFSGAYNKKHFNLKHYDTEFVALYVDGTQYGEWECFILCTVKIICDAAHVITNVEAKWPGSVHDSRIYGELTLSNRLECGEIDGFLLRDKGYPCKPTLMTPYPEPEPVPQQSFNVAHCRTRAWVEMTIGLLKGLFSVPTSPQ